MYESEGASADLRRSRSVGSGIVCGRSVGSGIVCGGRTRAAGAGAGAVAGAAAGGIFRSAEGEATGPPPPAAATIRLALTRHILRSCSDLGPLFVEFVGFHLYQKALLPCPIEQLINNLNDVAGVSKNSRKRLEKFSESLQESVAALCHFMAGLQEAIHSVKFQMLLGPSAGLPRDTFSLLIDTADRDGSDNSNSDNHNNNSNNNNSNSDDGATSPNSPYVAKLVKVLTRQMIVNSQILDYSSNTIPVRNIFFFVKINLFPGSESALNFEDDTENCPLFQFYTYRQGFQPKLRKNCKEKVVTFYRSDAGGQNTTTTSSADTGISSAGTGTTSSRFCTKTLDFVLKKGLSIRF